MDIFLITKNNLDFAKCPSWPRKCKRGLKHWKRQSQRLILKAHEESKGTVLWRNWGLYFGLILWVEECCQKLEKHGKSLLSWSEREGQDQFEWEWHIRNVKSFLLVRVEVWRGGMQRQWWEKDFWSQTCNYLDWWMFESWKSHAWSWGKKESSSTLGELGPAARR